jgi:5'-deoxynucleotidase YfbR-like HD superfamily hydrolase
MQNFVHEMLHDSPAALKIMSLWKEYEDQSTAEARFVKGGYRAALPPFSFGLLC